jgi:signal transduction histidine kinase
MQGYIGQHGPAAGGQLTLLRYSVAVASVAVGLLSALGLRPALDPEAPLLFAVLIAAWCGGLRPALLATLLSSLAVAYYFSPTPLSLAVDPGHISRVAMFMLLAASFAFLTAAQRRAQHALRIARDEMEARVRERTAELEELAGRLIHAQEEERSRIGRELHDHISQTLGVLTIKIDQLRAEEAIAPGVAAALDELRHDTTEITDDVHRLSHRLHSSTLDYLGLVPALQKLASEFSGRHDISIAFTHASLAPSLPSEVALCLFRIAEESLTNIAKHSQARSAHIQLTGAADGIHLRIEDSGTGFDMNTLGSKAGLGFVSMQERLRVLRGTVRVDSGPSRGTRIEAWVPSASLIMSIPEAEPGGTSAEPSHV